MSTITRLLARATGPGRCRTALHQKTRAVRRYREAFAPLGQVQTTVPRAVLGGDILDLLSDRLRALLDVEAAAAPLLSVDPAARTRFLSSLFAPQDTRDVFLTPPPAGQRGPFDAVDITSRGTPRALPPLTRRNGRHAESSWPLPPSLDRRRATPDSAPLQPSERRGLATAVGQGQTMHPRQHEAAIDPIFSRKIHEYWRLSAAEEREQTPPGISTAVRHDERHLPDMANLPGQVPETHAWPEVTGRELATRLQAFAAGQGFDSASVPPAQEPTPSHIEDRMDTLNGMPTARHMDNTTTLQALSEDMATILRDQALYHGIDLT